MSGITLAGGTFNIRGFRNSFPAVKDWMTVNSLDFAVITETQLMDDMLPLNRDEWLQDVIRQPSTGKQGRAHGGLALMANPASTHKILRLRVDPQGRFGVWEICGIIVIGVYLAPSLEPEEFQAVLDDTAVSLHGTHQAAMVLGDFNALLETKGTMAGGPDHRGRILQTWARTNCLTIERPPGRRVATTSAGNWLDYILTNEVFTGCRRITQTDESYAGLSDHLPIHTTVHGLMLEREVTVLSVDDNQRWKLTKLHNHKTRGKYKDELDNRFKEALPVLKAKASTVTEALRV